MSASLPFAPRPLAVLPQPLNHPDFIFELKYDGFRAFDLPWKDGQLRDAAPNPTVAIKPDLPQQTVE